VKPRFFVFIVLIVLIVAFGMRLLAARGQSTAVVTLGSTDDARSVEAVVVRDEYPYYVDGLSRVVHVAREGAQVMPGEAIAYVYASTYVDSNLRKLETLRQDIRHYHIRLLSRIVDRELELLDNNVLTKALQLKQLVTQKTRGSLLGLQAQLDEAMRARQDFLRENHRQDPKINQLYDEERKYIDSINNWRSVKEAERAGTVSFYLDGWEDIFTADNIMNVSAQTLAQALRGEAPGTQNIQRGMIPLYRLVSTDHWELLIISLDRDWTPMPGQVFRFQMEGFEDVIYSGSVISQQALGDGRETVVLLEVRDPIGPLSNVRKGRVSLGTNLSGMRVPLSALVSRGNEQGVRVADVGEGVFVPVEVLTRDNRYALVQPVIEGTLLPGQSVYTY